MAILNKFLRENKVSKMTKAQRNAWYNALSKPEKAVAVCEDVLLQIKNEKYVMESGVYMRLEIDNDITQRTVNDIFKKEALDEVISAKSITCNVCAMGSCMMSAVRLGNEVEVSDLFQTEEDNSHWLNSGNHECKPGGTIISNTNENLDWSKLEEAFTEKEYRAMEFMFEGSDVNGTFSRVNDEYNTLEFLSDNDYSHLDDTNKMIKMCKQIIKDKGYFLVEGVDLENKDK